MTYEETKEHIETEVSEICDKIADVYGELWEQFLVNQGGMDSSLHDDQKRHDIECEDLCKRVKALGELAMVVNQIKDNYITVTSAQSPEFGIGVYRRVCGDGTLEK